MIAFKQKATNTVAIICLIIATFLLSIAAYKAHTASFTHDESYTYNHYVNSSLKTTVLFLDNPTANNHILNTLLMAVFSRIFGNSELALRLPNLIAYLFFLLFTFKILDRAIANRILVVISFIIINCNPFLIDFFSLARGYGITVFLTTASLYFLLTFSETSKTKHYTYSLLFALLATYSNISSLYFLCGIIIAYNIFILIDFTGDWKTTIRYIIQKNKISLIFSALTFSTLAWPIFTLSKHNQFYFGGENNFWSDTIISLIHSTLYGNYYNGYGEKTLIALSTITLLSIVLILWRAQAKNKILLIVYLIGGIIITINTHHYTLGSKLIIGRTALFLIPLSTIYFCFVLHWISNTEKLKFLAYTIGITIAITAISHTTNSYSFEKYANWDYDKNSKEVINLLENEAKNHTQGNIVLGINWLFEPTLNFYIKTRKLNWIDKVNRDGINDKQDYYYIFESDTIQLNEIRYKVIRRFNDTNTILAKKI